jgi:PH (Pleckstrin Homology) domain-containing protein
MNEVFRMIPATGKTMWLLFTLALFLLFLLGLFGYIAYSSRNVRFEISQKGCGFEATSMGGVPAVSLLAGESKRIDLQKESPYRPRLRTNGIGLPGYRSGWWKLRNGEKALLFVTDLSNVVYIPTRQGYCLLLSPERPEVFLQSLRMVSP